MIYFVIVHSETTRKQEKQRRGCKALADMEFATAIARCLKLSPVLGPIAFAIEDVRFYSGKGGEMGIDNDYPTAENASWVLRMPSHSRLVISFDKEPRCSRKNA